MPSLASSSSALLPLGWHAQLHPHPHPFPLHLHPARVSAEHRTQWQVLAAHHQPGTITTHVAEVSGSLLKAIYAGQASRPAVGDWVLIHPLPGEDRVVIHSVLPRQGRIRRRAAGQDDGDMAEQCVAANITHLLIVGAMDDRRFWRRLARFLALAHDGGASPVVVLTKADLVPDTSAQAEILQQIHAVAAGAPALVLSARSGQGLHQLAPYMVPGNTLAVLGASGAGKSSLLNALVGSDFATGEVRADDGRGRHTTTARSLVLHPSGAVLVDTPGLREVALADGQALHAGFADIAALSQRCKHSDCTHRSEPGCGVLAAIATGELHPRRLVDWRQLLREAAYSTRSEATSARLHSAKQAAQVRLAKREKLARARQRDDD